MASECGSGVTLGSSTRLLKHGTLHHDDGQFMWYVLSMEARKRTLDELINEGISDLLTHADFHIGLEFTTGDPNKPARWRCTDVGKRTIAAIKLEVDDPNWWAYKGPPYGAAEYVFDENDFAGCHPVKE